MKKCLLAGMVIGALYTGTTVAQVKVEEIGVIGANNPAFLSLEQVGSETNLMICSFAPFSSGSVSRIEDIGGHLGHLRDLSPTKLADVTWPNEVKKAPTQVWGDGFYTIAGGFLVPGQSDGAISLYSADSGKVESISALKKGYFYHHVGWVDMNGDGKADILTARASKPMFGGGDAELVWFEQPADSHKFPWPEHVIGKGPDVNFAFEDYFGNGSYEILAPQFFNPGLTLWTKSGPTWQSRMIDSKLGHGFNLQFVDINNDGKKDVLVTNHESDSKASVIVYEVPADASQPWVKHVILTGIKTTAGGSNQASPGSALAFWPHVAKTNEKPYIIVAGDGSQKAHLLVPKSADPAHWDYSEQIIFQAKKGVIGQIAVKDVDGDGQAEIFVPAYDEGTIHVYRLVLP